jgi:hypothetical protein
MGGNKQPPPAVTVEAASAAAYLRADAEAVGPRAVGPHFDRPGRADERVTVRGPSVAFVTGALRIAKPDIAEAGEMTGPVVAAAGVGRQATQSEGGHEDGEMDPE